MATTFATQRDETLLITVSWFAGTNAGHVNIIETELRPYTVEEVQHLVDSSCVAGRACVISVERTTKCLINGVLHTVVEDISEMFDLDERQAYVSMSIVEQAYSAMGAR